MRIRMLSASAICGSGFSFSAPPHYDTGMEKMLAKRIKGIRVSMGLNQTEFAERLGATQSTVTRWESGSRPAYGALQKIAAIANMTVDKLLNLNNDSAIREGGVPVVGYVGAGGRRHTVR